MKITKQVKNNMIRVLDYVLSQDSEVDNFIELYGESCFDESGQLLFDKLDKEQKNHIFVIASKLLNKLEEVSK